MEDLKYITKCSHRITREELHIEPAKDSGGNVIPGVFMQKLSLILFLSKGKHLLGLTM